MPMEKRVFAKDGDELYPDDLAEELALIPEFSLEPPEPIDVSKISIGMSSNTPTEVEQMRKVVEKHISIFEDSGNAAPPQARSVLCDIDVGDSKPVKQRARRVRPEFLKLHVLLKVLLKGGLIRFSTSSWASPIVIVRKKNGEDIRLCIDYRIINALTKLMWASMPVIDELLLNFDAVMWMCSFDACSGFWSVGMTQRASDISAFICQLGHFQWLRMPQGLKNAPQIYQRMMDNALWGTVRPKGGWKPLADKEATEQETEDSVFPNREANDDMHIFSNGEVDYGMTKPIFHRRSYIDDIAFGATTWDECCELLEAFLSRMTECGISPSLPKSQFGQKKVEFLSHYVSSDGIEAKPKDLPGLQELRYPTSKKGLQSFLGTLNYYNKFIQDFSAQAAILYEFAEIDFSNQDKKFRAKKAFELLKQRMCETPILRHFDQSLPADVIIFANDWAIGATIAQEYEGKLHPVRFTSRVLKEGELRYHLAEKEILALLRVLKVYFSMLRGRRIRVYARFTTMQWVITSKSLSGRIQQFAVMLSPWELEVHRSVKGECELTGLLTAAIVSSDVMDDVLKDIFPNKASAPRFVVPPILLPRTYEGLLLSTDGSAKPPEKGSDGSFGFVVWKLPEWDIVSSESNWKVSFCLCLLHERARP